MILEDNQNVIKPRVRFDLLILFIEKSQIIFLNSHILICIN